MYNLKEHHRPTPWTTHASRQMSDQEYLWAYIHWLEEWLKAVTERLSQVETELRREQNK